MEPEKCCCIGPLNESGKRHKANVTTFREINQQMAYLEFWFINALCIH